MTPQRFLETAVLPALKMLPRVMDSAAARQLMVAICLQESRLIYRTQIGGPARSYGQFEQGGGVKGVLNHSKTSAIIKRVCADLDIVPTAPAIYEAMAFNDILACVMVRLLLWTVPGKLPDSYDYDASWKLYVEGWRPGKPRRETWNGLYDQARESVAAIHPLLS